MLWLYAFPIVTQVARMILLAVWPAEEEAVEVRLSFVPLSAFWLGLIVMDGYARFVRLHYQAVHALGIGSSKLSSRTIPAPCERRRRRDLDITVLSVGHCHLSTHAAALDPLGR